MKIHQLAILIGLLLAAGCTGTNPPGQGNVNGSVFLEQGCVDAYNDGRNLNCSSLGLEQRFSCNHIALANITGFSPNLEIAECWTAGWEDSEQEGILHGGCMLRQSATYLAAVWNGSWEFEKLETWEEFRSQFGPVESKEEALAFALAYSGDLAYSGEIPSGMRRFAPAHATSVEEGANGYTVNLLDYQFCGCGPHPYYENTYLVNRTGEVGLVSSVRIYENPEQDGLCVD
jgi:hypothetical protein